MTTNPNFPALSVGVGLAASSVGWVADGGFAAWWGTPLVGLGFALALGRPAWWLWRCRHRALTSGIGVTLIAAAYGLLQVGRTGWAVALFAGGPVLVVLPWAMWLWRGRYGAQAMIARWDRQTKKSGGVASRWDRYRLSSRLAMKVRWASKLRPQLAHQADVMIPDVRYLLWVIRPLEAILSWLLMGWVIFRTPVSTYATYIGRDSYGGYWVPNNSVIVRLAAARGGKSVAMADRIIRHHGPAVVASTRKDLLLLTAQLRAQNTGPFYVLNAGNVGDIPSNLKISVLSGCKDMTTAELTAADLIGEAPDSERAYWNDQAARVLAPLMYAAAWEGASMRRVANWVAAGDKRAEDAWIEIGNILMRTPDGPAAIASLTQFFGMVGVGDRTRLSITHSLQPALSWLSNPRTAALGDAPVGEADLFDVKRDLLQANATIYILGAKRRGVGSLTGALIARIVREAAELAETMPGGKLEAQLLMALDELPLTCPGPVQHWVKDMGGRGIPFDLGVQQRAGLDEVFGVEGRRVILGNAHAVLLGPGCNDPIEVADWSRLSGLRKTVREVHDAEGKLISTSLAEVPVVDHGQIMAIELGKVIVFTRSRISEIRTPNAEARRDVKRAKYVAPVETNFEKESEQ